MAHRAWSLRYTAAKFQLAVDEIALSLQKAASLPQAIEAGLGAYRRSLTSVLFLTGAAMAPTLNPPKAADSVERLLVRLIPRPSPSSVFAGDVVAFTSPLASAGASALDSAMVRRVAAVEGDEMVSEDPEVEGFTLPKDTVWVLADNEELEPPHVIDSRTFGPLPLSAILGRCVYSVRSEADHGPVENSEGGMAADAAVIEAELDLDSLVAEVPRGD